MNVHNHCLLHLKKQTSESFKDPEKYQTRKNLLWTLTSVMHDLSIMHDLQLTQLQNSILEECQNLLQSFIPLSPQSYIHKMQQNLQKCLAIAQSMLTQCQYTFEQHSCNISNISKQLQNLFLKERNNQELSCKRKNAERCTSPDNEKERSCKRKKIEICEQQDRKEEPTQSTYNHNIECAPQDTTQTTTQGAFILSNDQKLSQKSEETKGCESQDTNCESQDTKIIELECYKRLILQNKSKIYDFSHQIVKFYNSHENNMKHIREKIPQDTTLSEVFYTTTTTIETIIKNASEMLKSYNNSLINIQKLSVTLFSISDSLDEFADKLLTV